MAGRPHIKTMTEPTINIVVIDDSKTSISLYKLSSEPLDVRLRTFESPREALVFLEDNDASLIFLDILMREMDGLTTLKRLRDCKRHGETPVVMATSKDYAQDRNKAKELGAIEFLVKPLRSQEIREVIRKYTSAPDKQAATGDE